MEALSVNVPALRQAAAEATDAGIALRKAKAAASGQLAVIGAPRWSAAAESLTADDLWSATLDRLSALLGKLGEDLAAAAGRYESTDQAAADSIRRTGPPTPR